MKKTNALISVRNISKSYGKHLVLDNISFDLNEGEIIGVIGPSGSGKTTLLKCLDFLTFIDTGVINIDNLNIKVNTDKEIEIRIDSEKELMTESSLIKLREKIGFVFQAFNLWEERTVLQNITLAPIKVQYRNKDEVKEAAKELCSQFGLNEKLYSKVYELSGGQKQRVAIIRALMMNPKFMFLDEITSALDPILTSEVLEAIKQLRNKGLSMLIVTHHIHFASNLCDRLMFLDKGRIIQLDKPNVLKEYPQNSSIKTFLKTLESVG
jgi:ABC-type polar amino acid transport system ATPase subunit